MEDYLHKLESGDTDSDSELGDLKARIGFELAEVSEAVTRFAELYTDAGKMLREMQDKLARVG